MKQSTCYNTRLPDRDVIEREVECDSCHGSGVKDMGGEGGEIDCPECSGTGRVIIKS